MNTLGTYKKYTGIEIWKDDFYYKEEMAVDFAIGHSLGANFILQNHDKFKKSKIILVNPLLPRHSCLKWLRSFLKFHWQEGLNPDRQLVKGIKYYITGIWKAYKLMQKDLLSFLDNLPKENVFVIRGKRDCFFWEDSISLMLKERGANLIEIDEVGHNWHAKIDEEIEKIVA